MRIDATGTHIKSAANAVIQHSQSQPNSLAFLDEDGHWVHIDASTIQNLYSSLANIVAKQKPVSMNKPTPGGSDNLFADHFKS